MTYFGDTGQGAVATFAALADPARLRGIQLNELTMEAIDASALADNGLMKKIAADLTDGGAITLTAIFHATAAIQVPDGVVDTLTITFPIGVAANTQAATLAVTGFLTANRLPNMALSELMEYELELTLDGDQFDFTPEAA